MNTLFIVYFSSYVCVHDSAEGLCVCLELIIVVIIIVCMVSSRGQHAQLLRTSLYPRLCYWYVSEWLQMLYTDAGL